MKTLSVFVDESGDFGAYKSHSPFYLFTLVFHDQDKEIKKDIERLNSRILEHGFDIHAIHSGPIIRNEGYYQDYTFEERKKLFNDLLFFTKSVEIKYHTVWLEKKHMAGKGEMVERLSKSLAVFLRENLAYFTSFDKIKVYYDNGQSEITTILTSVFSSMFGNVEFKRVQPCDYKLFQVADMICTIELSKLNFDNKVTTKSEEKFFESRRRSRDFYYKTISKKRME